MLSVVYVIPHRSIPGNSHVLRVWKSGWQACGAFDPIQFNTDNIRWIKSMIRRVNITLMLFSPSLK